MQRERRGGRLLLAGQLAWWSATSGVITTMIALDPGAALAEASLVSIWSSWVVAGGLWTTVGAAVAMRFGVHEMTLRRAAPRAMAGLVAATPCVMLTIVAIGELWGWPSPPPEDEAPAVFMMLVLSALSAWAIAALALAQGASAERARRQALRAQALANRAQLEMLRHQLDPHFVFNALNSIAAVIDEDRERAQTMILHLCTLLRASLGPSEHDGTLADELHRLRLYLAVEQARFEDELRVTLDHGRELDHEHCLPLLLQPLVENALKHGEPARAGEPLEVALRLYRDARGWLVAQVDNSGRWAAQGTGVGLENTRARLDAAYGRDFSRMTIGAPDVCTVRVEIAWDPRARIA